MTGRPGGQTGEGGGKEGGREVGIGTKGEKGGSRAEREGHEMTIYIMYNELSYTPQ